MVEKPLATSAALAAEICLEARRHQRILAVGHIFLHNPAVQAMRQLIISGEVGQLQYIASQRLSLGIVRPDVDAMWNLAPHDISIAQYLFGEPPREVSATGTDCLGTGRCDVQALTVCYGDGRAAFHTVSWLHPRKVREVTVVGSRRMMVFDDVAAERKLTVYDKGIDRPATGAAADAPAHPSLPGFRNFSEFQWVQRAGDIFAPLLPYAEPMTVELADFASCIRTGGTPVADGRSALAVVATLEAASLSLAQGGSMVPVVIPPLDSLTRP
jgi:predicted dehydrogenase